MALTNSVEIMCRLDAGECTEFLAQLVTRGDDGVTGVPWLFTYVESFRIRSFEKGILLASAGTRAFDIDLRIDTRRLSAERSARET